MRCGPNTVPSLVLTGSNIRLSSGAEIACCAPGWRAVEAEPAIETATAEFLVRAANLERVALPTTARGVCVVPACTKSAGSLCKGEL